MQIIVRKSQSWSKKKDALDKERKKLAEEMKPGMMSASQMQKGDDGFMSHDEQVKKYDQWREKNEGNMRRWGEINKEFKAQGDEGRSHSLDDIRPDGKLILD